MSTRALLPRVLRILREAGKALSPAEVKNGLYDMGLSGPAAEAAWLAVRSRIKTHDQVVVEGSRYRWVPPHPKDPSPVEALDLLLEDGLPGLRRSALAEVIREALAERGQDEARKRQATIDSLRQLADLASEVEELIVNQTDPPVMIRQVRAWVKRSGLDPVGKAGEATRFDRKKHEPIAGHIRDGAPVVVVRPGYIWKGSTEDVLLGKAVVEE